MGIFGKKQTTGEVPPKVGKIAGFTRNLAMNTVHRSIKELYKNKRLKLLPDDQAEFVEKDGTEKVWALDELAADLWMKMDAQSSRMTNLPAFAALDIKPEDVKQAIIQEGK